jgi:sugar phosphate isomerase/epimerase
MSWEVIMHINYCEQGQTIEETCKKAVAWGFDGVEFRRKRSKVDETVEGYLDSIAKGVEKSGLKIVTFGGPGPNLANEDQALREADIEEVIHFYKLATQRFNFSVCNITSGSLLNQDKSIPYIEYEKHGSFIATEEQWKWAVDGFKALGEMATELKFKLALETHMCYIHDLPVAAKKLVDMVDNPAIGINLDYGNAVFFKNKPDLEETIQLVKDNLYYVHLKNSIWLKDESSLRVGLGEGEINHRVYLKLLKSIGYKGPICIEAPRSGDREWYAKQDIKYIRSVIDDIG